MSEEQEMILKQITFPHKDYWLTRKDIKIEAFNLFGELSYIITYKNISFEVFDDYIDEKVYNIYQNKLLLECLNHFNNIFENSTITLQYDWHNVFKIEKLDYTMFLHTLDIFSKCGDLNIYDEIGDIEIRIKSKDEINQAIVFNFDNLDDNLIAYLYDLACLIQKRIFYKKILK